MADNSERPNAVEKSDRNKPFGAARVWQSDELLQGQTEALIVHEGKVYRLRRTRNQKLILVK